MIEIRRIHTHVEDIFHEFGPVADQPLRRGFIAAVLTNPFAGRFEPNILPMMEALNAVGTQMAHQLLAAMAVSVEQIEGYGKGAIIGAAGELEHGALWHVPGGYAMRELLGWSGDRAAYVAGTSATNSVTKTEVNTEAKTEAKSETKGEVKAGQSGNALSIVPSTKKVGPPGCTLDVPLTHINASYVRSHFDAIEARVPGAPLPDEVVYVLAMSTGQRVHARVGGLKAADIAQWNGLR